VQTRRDHLQAYQFSIRRLAHAVTAGDPGPGEPVFRRANFGAVLGAGLAVLICGAAVVFGLISPAPTTAWRKPGAVIVEKESGTRYLLLGGVLRPTLNYASALLASGAGGVQIVSRGDLAGIPVGSQIGIPGAPDALPPAASLASGAWALCLAPGGTGATYLDLGPVGRVAGTPAGRPILIATQDAHTTTEYVLWGRTVYPVPDRSVLAALGLGAQVPVTVPAPWLAMLSHGIPLAAASVPSAGTPGPAVAGRAGRVGQVFQTTTAAGVEQYYLLRTDGLAPITRTEASLFSVRPGTDDSVTRLTPPDIARTPASSDVSLLSRLPDLVSQPAFAPDRASLCVLQAAAAGSPPYPVLEDGTATGSGKVHLPTGSALLAQSPTVVPGTDAGRLYLITDAGVKFPIAGANAVQALGYNGAPAHVVPDMVLDQIPTGRTLAVPDAVKAVPWGTP
jgi:type VII secretion protein EccB